MLKFTDDIAVLANSTKELQTTPGTFLSTLNNKLFMKLNTYNTFIIQQSNLKLLIKKILVKDFTKIGVTSKACGNFGAQQLQYLVTNHD